MLYRSTTYTAGIQQTTKLWKILSRLTLSTCTVCVHSWVVLLCVSLFSSLFFRLLLCFFLTSTARTALGLSKSDKSYHLPNWKEMENIFSAELRRHERVDSIPSGNVPLLPKTCVKLEWKTMGKLPIDCGKFDCASVTSPTRLPWKFN